MMQPPEEGSPEAQMKDSDRGQLCDTCFEHLHDNEAYNYIGKAEARQRRRQIFARSREAYLVKHQLKVCPNLFVN